MEYNVDGVARYIYRLIDYFNKRRITSLFVTGKLPTAEHQDAPMICVPSFTLPIYKQYPYALPIKVKKIIQDFQPDVMHFHSPFSLAWAALVYGHRMGIPVVATYHLTLFGAMWPLLLTLPFIMFGGDTHLFVIIVSAFFWWIDHIRFMWYVFNSVVKVSELNTDFGNYYPRLKFGKISVSVTYFFSIIFVILVFFVEIITVML